MTTDTTAIGYVNGILYLEQDDDNNMTQVEQQQCYTSSELRSKKLADTDNAAITTSAAAAHKQRDENAANARHAHDNSHKQTDIHNGIANQLAIVSRNDAAADKQDNTAGDAEDTDSLASMETLSDNVSIWIDGEKHWISGVDASTTCSELILALLSYQDGDGKNTEDFAKGLQQPAAGSAHQSLQQSVNAKESNSKQQFAGGITPRIEELLSEYVIVKQHRHCEEYLDGSAKVFDVLPTRDTVDRKECELLLRRLVTATPQLNTQVASLLSTDKDSGMGSPVGSSRSAKFRRKKYKATTAAASHWLAPSQTLHPKFAQKTSTSANERLLKIILAQDETIHRQLTLLREKERQILKIEEEKHRVRERELGKNYLLETYLNGLDEADIEKDYEAGIELFVDEPYEMLPLAATQTQTTAAIAITQNQRRAARKQQQQQQQLLSKDASKPSTTAANVNLNATKQPQQSYVALADVDATASNTAPTITTTTPAAVLTATGNNNTNNASETTTQQQEQLFWLEKVYGINKRLQREEEQLLKLHAKIRKHQVKRAYQTKHEVIEQIDKLDNELALQSNSIRQLEDGLQQSNEQLKQKLSVLEELSHELLLCSEAGGRELIAEPEVMKSKAKAPNLLNKSETVAALAIDVPKKSAIELKLADEAAIKPSTTVKLAARTTFTNTTPSDLPSQKTQPPPQQQPHKQTPVVMLDRNLLPMRIDKIGNKELFGGILPSGTPTLPPILPPLASHMHKLQPATTYTEFVCGTMTTGNPASTKLEHQVDITCLGTLV